MSDSISPERRSYNMSRVRGKDTKPEKLVRSVLHRLGFRFRKNVSELPGKPDIVLPKYKTIIFVHGCFWHQHEGCKKSHLPKSNVEFWANKLSKNVVRDRESKEKLISDGWSIFVVWECETKKVEELERKLLGLFAK
jgi:DNA mismatch endonuclease (patch repair protein)